MELELDRPDGTVAEVSLLRSPEWIAERGIEPGAKLFLDLPEMDVEGDALVIAVGEPWADDTAASLPELQAGQGGSRGRRITGLFRHKAARVYNLKVTGESPLGVTASHPIWSTDRRAWVAAAALYEGEHTKAITGCTITESVTIRETVEPVFNLEVDADHCYRVGEQGILVHNASIPTMAPAAGIDFGCGAVSGSGGLDRDKPTKLNSNIEGGVPKGYEGHHLIGVDEAKASKVMQRAAQLGYDINRRNNGAAFPSYGKNVGVTLDQGKAEALKQRLPLHKGEHADAVYTGCIRAILRKIENDYVAGLISDCDLCDVIKLWEDRILQALFDHKIWLNKYDPHIEPGQKGACPTT